MANYSCNSCEDLRNTSPNFVVHGITDTECTSLQNDTGLNPSSGHNDCTDLNNINDCLVGNMAEEVEAYDVCDWKTYMKKFVPNLWTTLKSIICAICGLWKNITDLSEKIDNICRLQEATLEHPVHAYGTLPNGSASRRGGNLGQKNGSNILAPLAHSDVSDEVWAMQNVGINYGTLEVESCSTGKCIRHEWISPDIIAYKFNQVPAINDVLWYCSKSTAQDVFGITDEQWEAKVANTVGWSTDFSAGNAIIGLRLGVANNRLELRMGSIVGDTYASLNGATIRQPADQAERLYRFNCTSNS